MHYCGVSFKKGLIWIDAESLWVIMGYNDKPAGITP